MLIEKYMQILCNNCLTMGVCVLYGCQQFRSAKVDRYHNEHFNKPRNICFIFYYLNKFVFAACNSNRKYTVNIIFIKR